MARSSMENHLTRRLAIALGLLVAGAVAWGLYRRHVAHRPLEWSGTVEARTIDVGSRVGGRVESVLVREGDRVDAKQALITLEAFDLDGQRLQSEGALEQA